MPTTIGRDGPAEEKCRGDSLAAASPASDQTPTASKSGFFHGNPSLGATQSVPLGGFGDVLPPASGGGERRTRSKTKAEGPRQVGSPSFRGTVNLEFRASGARKAFILALLLGDGPPPDATGGACVRGPQRPRLPAGTAAAYE